MRVLVLSNKVAYTISIHHN